MNRLLDDGSRPAGSLSLEEKALLALPWIGGAVAILIAPFVVGLFLGNEWVRMLSVAWIFVILAVGLALIVGKAGLPDLGYVAYFAVGAYATAILGSSEIGISLSFWLLLPLAAGLGAALAFGLGTLSLKFSGFYLPVLTLAVGAAAAGGIQVLDQSLGGAPGIGGIFPPSLGGFSLGEGGALFGTELPAPYRVYYFTLAWAGAAVAAALLITRRTAGYEPAPLEGDAWAGSREGTLASVQIWYAVAGALGGLAGSLFASVQGIVEPGSFVLWQAFLILGMVLLGGKDHPWGAALGALVVTVAAFLLEQQGNYVQRLVFGRIELDPDNFSFLLMGLVLVLVPLFWRQGLWPSRNFPREKSGS